MMAELEVPDWIRKDRKSNFASTIVAVAPPRMQEYDGAEFEFEEELSSQVVLSEKKALRHRKVAELLGRDPMLVVPKD